MDPITIWLIAGGGGAALVGAVVALFRRGRTSAPQLPSPVVPPDIQSPPPAEEVKPVPIVPVVVRPAPPPPRGEPLERILKSVVQHVTFCSKMVEVGTRQVERSLGRRDVEVSYPADDISIRPMRDMSELGRLLPTELVQDSDMLLARLAGNEAIVSVPVESQEIFETVHEPEWRERRRILYVLLDVSPSMYPGAGEVWRVDVWRPLVIQLLEHAHINEAVFLSRTFCGNVRDLRRAAGEEEVSKQRRYFEQVVEGDSTDIPLAIETAMRDFKKEEYDEGWIVIVTDGENNQSFDPQELRGRLKAARLHLHAVLLGAKNEALREAADLYQVIEPVSEQGRFLLHGPVKRTGA